MKSLVDAGHQVTVVSPFSRELSKDNFTSIIDLSDTLPIQVAAATYNQFAKPSTYNSIYPALLTETNLCHVVYNSKAFQVKK